MTNTTKVVIVGGGFAGIKTALELSKCANCDVTLVSDHSHFRYYPGLYHAATGGKRSGSRIRIENILQGSDIKFVRATVTKLDREKNHIETIDGKKISFDSLVLALGNVTNYFGIPGMAEYSYGIKSTEEAERFKQHLHQVLAENGAPDLNYVIVGGGPTGIELAGALPGYMREIMKKHGLPERKLHIKLVEAAPRLLPRSPKDISQAVGKRLRALGIDVMLGTAVAGATPDSLTAGDKPLKSHTIVWTAGVANNPFFKANNFALNDRGKVQVDEYLQAEPGIFVIGDNAGTEYSGLAQTALYDGIFVANNIERASYGEDPEVYVPKEPIYVIPVGKNWASVQWGKRHFSGYIGWILRSLADLVAFHDLQSWPKAGEQWIRSMEDENLDCPNCAPKN
ncbi:MAG TPA: NAD(P)/FAD-dependent oxidoreductase [Bacillota bacterium]|nr:NAD(P)/FAD-dependent oxidoreductase [Bacillota bacterium]